MSSLHVERSYEFAPSIVWDALVDADLVSGWLAEATIVPLIGGEYTLRFLNRDSPTPREGRITRLEPHSMLGIMGGGGASLQFQLTEVAGGNRGASTMLAVDIESPTEQAFLARLRADWLTNLDQLDDLLHGHPVDWLHWYRDRAADWTEHLRESGGDPGRSRPGSRSHPHG